METSQRELLEVMTWIQQFLTTNAEFLAGIIESSACQALDQVVSQLGTHAREQSRARQAGRSETASQGGSRDEPAKVSHATHRCRRKARDGGHFGAPHSHATTPQNDGRRPRAARTLDGRRGAAACASTDRRWAPAGLHRAAQGGYRRPRELHESARPPFSDATWSHARARRARAARAADRQCLEGACRTATRRQPEPRGRIVGCDSSAPAVRWREAGPG
jgi:hypothetical protein